MIKRGYILRLNLRPITIMVWVKLGAQICLIIAASLPMLA